MLLQPIVIENDIEINNEVATANLSSDLDF